MTDIVTLVGELTAVRGQRDTLMVEIERLRGELKKQPAESLVVLDLKEQLMSKDTEIERLHSEVKRWREAHDYEVQLRGMAAEEIERLRGELDVASLEVQRLERIWDTNSQKEIERLRDKALRFDLDQAGIERREREAVELVEGRAEIEQLRQMTELEVGLWRDNAQLKAEIERLQGNNEKLLLDNLELRNEIERLRKELAEKDDYIRTVSRPIGAHSYE